MKRGNFFGFKRDYCFFLLVRYDSIQVEDSQVNDVIILIRNVEKFYYFGS